MQAELHRRRLNSQTIFGFFLPIFLSTFFVVGCQRSMTEGGDSKYSLGTLVKFGTGGNSEAYKREGWSATEEAFTWSTGSTATLVLTLPPANSSLNLRMRLGGLYKAPTLKAQNVELYVNDKKLEDWQVKDSADFTTRIPVDLVKKGGDLKIELKTPNAVSPKSLGMGEDTRVLGVACTEMIISPG